MATKELGKAFEPADAEKRLYDYWLKNKYFHAQDKSEAPAFSIVIPPPNVTGMLHMGHALNNTLQDIIIRFKRMQGYNTLWMPGMDHAGIATQNVVEQQLMKEGLSRHDLGREKFIARVWEWKEKYGGVIINQLKRLGCSCDWERERFTMDEGLSQAVREVFVRLYNEDMIYQGDYIVNWCPRCHTAISDLEVEFKQDQSFLWNIRYPFADGSGDIVVATTRPETMLGDTAVAVNPEMIRYKDKIGKFVILPFSEQKNTDHCRRLCNDGFRFRRGEDHPGFRSQRLCHGPAPSIWKSSPSWTVRALSMNTEANTKDRIAMKREKMLLPIWKRAAIWSAPNLTLIMSASATAAKRTLNRWCPNSGLSKSNRWPSRPLPP